MSVMFEMDPEKQPLLTPSTSNVRYTYRPLTSDEVRASRRELPWRRMRIFLVLSFWGVVAMFISMVVCMLITSPPCEPLGPGPSVPPAHLTFAPLISRARIMNQVYAV